MSELSRPNVVLIIADDMGYGDFGRFNNGYVETPALDQLIDDGTCLTQHYAGSAVCSPSRAALLTGRYPIRTGAITPQEVLGLDRIALGETTIADHFKSAGYATGMVGKWHNGALDPRFHPNARGFDEFAGFRGGWADYYKWRLDRNGQFEMSDGRYLTDVLTQEAIGFIQRHQSEPFFLMVPYNAPHSPLQAPEAITDKYVSKGLSRGIALTYAMIEVMDQGVAAIRQLLETTGLSDNTIFMFTSDNGPALMLRDDQVPEGVSVDTTRWNCGFNGAKGSVYEGGIRVPMIMHWPVGMPGGGRELTDAMHFIDWLPTLASMCDVPIDGGKPLDGVDVTQILQGDAQPSYPDRFWQWNGYRPIGTSNAAMRSGSWKLVRPVNTGIHFATPEDEELSERYVEKDIEYKYQPENIPEIFRWSEPNRVIPDPPPVELYDLNSDPNEQNNLAADQPQRVTKMLNELQSWFEEVETERQAIPAV